MKSELELQRMNYQELIQLEDEMMLQNELDTTFRIRNSGGRMIIFVLGVIFFFLYLQISIKIASGIPENSRGLFSFPAYILSLFLGVVSSHYLWKSIGTGARTLLRYALHYWPVAITIWVMFKVYS